MSDKRRVIRQEGNKDLHARMTINKTRQAVERSLENNSSPTIEVASTFGLPPYHSSRLE